MLMTICSQTNSSTSRRSSNWTAPVFAVLLGILPLTAAEKDPFSMHETPPIAGRWDVTVQEDAGEFPSWFEIEQSGFRTLVGRYVGQFGSARPIGEIKFDPGNGSFRFSLPPQWERRTTDVVFEGKIDGEVLRGETSNDQGKAVKWEARRAPSLVRASAPKWGRSIKLFNGRDLSGFKPRDAGKPNGWEVQDGLLVNARPGNDLLTERQFNDFKLRAEIRYPKGSNSGIYLRGRYEVQIEDNFGQEINSHRIGGVYGFLTPRVNAAKPAGEWQTIEITLVGRVVTVVLNGEAIIERQTIPGITGGALDSAEGNPGPLLIQGDHGPVEFRVLTLTPAK